MIDVSKKIITGAVVAMPTDTVYGLICDANNKSAIERIYAIKGRNNNKPIGIFVKDIKSIYKYIDSNIDDSILSLMNKYWPGPLTIIFKKKEGVLTSLNINNDTIGIRIPNDPCLLRVLKETNLPLAQTSCNLSGEKPYTSSKEIKQKFANKIDIIVDGELPITNVSSTIIDISSGKIVIVRHGEISEKEGF